MSNPKTNLRLYNSQEKPTWCPGCGDYGILVAVKQAAAGAGLLPHQVMIVSGIGCGSKLPHYMHANGFNNLHGRSLPIAQGIKLANHEMTVIVVTGDGDGLGIGAGHFVHTCRRNPDLTHLIQNNQVYGLTKGQYSPTSPVGFVTSTSPEGTIEAGINPVALSLINGSTFVARTFAGDPKHMARILIEAIKHPGHAVIDALQPCVIYNKINTYDYYRQRVYKLEDTDYDPSDRGAALQKSLEWDEQIPIGIIYQESGRPSYESQVDVLRAGPLNRQPMDGQSVEAYEGMKTELV